jgi:hypothetical protein
MMRPIWSRAPALQASRGPLIASPQADLASGKSIGDADQRDEPDRPKNIDHCRTPESVPSAEYAVSRDMSGAGTRGRAHFGQFSPITSLEGVSPGLGSRNGASLTAVCALALQPSRSAGLILMMRLLCMTVDANSPRSNFRLAAF